MDTTEIKNLMERCASNLEQQIEWAKRWKSQTCLVECGWTLILKQDNSWSLLERMSDTEFRFTGEPTTTTYFNKENALKLSDGCEYRKGCEILVIHKNDLADLVLAEYPARLESFKADLSTIN